VSTFFLSFFLLSDMRCSHVATIVSFTRCAFGFCHYVSLSAVLVEKVMINLHIRRPKSRMTAHPAKGGGVGGQLKLDGGSNKAYEVIIHSRSVIPLIPLHTYSSSLFTELETPLSTWTKDPNKLLMAGSWGTSVRAGLQAGRGCDRLEMDVSSGDRAALGTAQKAGGAK